MATDEQIIATIDKTGHLNNPNGVPLPKISTVGLTLNHPRVIQGVASWQAFNTQALSRSVATLCGDSRASAAIRADGIVGDITRASFDVPRCAYPDYEPADDAGVAAAQGKGNWRGCYGVGDFHAVKIRIKNDPPAFLKPHWPEVLKNVQKMYAEVGLLIEWIDSGFANITTTFRNLGGSTIGLAQVVNGATCSSTQWADLNPNYRPSQIVVQWTSLYAHEICHGTGIGHASSGHMSPSIRSGLPLTWQGDVTRPLLVSRFGGKPVPIPGDDSEARKIILAYEYASGRLEKLDDLPSGGSPWPF